MTILQDRWVRQPPQIAGFSDTQSELDWYGSNPEGIDRDRTPNPCYSDDKLYPIKESEHESSLSEGEWSQPTYSDASRSPSPALKTLPVSNHPAKKRKASISLDEQKEPRRGSKRSKRNSGGRVNNAQAA